MNTKYIKTTDEVFIINEEDKIEKSVPNTDNIEDVLNQENKIEEIKWTWSYLK